MAGRVPREKLVDALRRMLRPVVRQMLHWEITYPVLDDLLRSLFVEVAYLLPLECPHLYASLSAS